MRKYYFFVVAAISLLIGCSNENNLFSQSDENQNGRIVVNVVWPNEVVGKKLRYAPDKISAFLYHSGKLITRADLVREGSRGTAEFIVAVQSGYRLEMVAFDQSFNQVLYTGFTDNITVSADATNTVDITMSDAAPVLYPVKKISDSSYTIFWSHIPLAASYLLEENTSNTFLSSDLLDDKKLSSTVYAGTDTLITFRDKEPGTYYYLVFPVTNYGDSYDPSPAGKENWNFYIGFKYGPVSNVISVQTGVTGSLKIDIPWPTR